MVQAVAHAFLCDMIQISKRDINNIILKNKYLLSQQNIKNAHRDHHDDTYWASGFQLGL